MAGEYTTTKMAVRNLCDKLRKDLSVRNNTLDAIEITMVYYTNSLRSANHSHGCYSVCFLPNSLSGELDIVACSRLQGEVLSHMLDTLIPVADFHWASEAKVLPIVDVVAWAAQFKIGSTPLNWLQYKDMVMVVCVDQDGVKRGILAVFREGPSPNGKEIDEYCAMCMGAELGQRLKMLEKINRRAKLTSYTEEDENGLSPSGA